MRKPQYFAAFGIFLLLSMVLFEGLGLVISFVPSLIVRGDNIVVLCAVSVLAYATVTTLGVLLFGYVALWINRLNRFGYLGAIVIAPFAAWRFIPYLSQLEQNLTGNYGLSSGNPAAMVAVLVTSAILLFLSIKILILLCKKNESHYVVGYGKRVIVLD